MDKIKLGSETLTSAMSILKAIMRTVEAEKPVPAEWLLLAEGDPRLANFLEDCA